MIPEIITEDFFANDVLTVAPALLGHYIVRKFDHDIVHRYMITEVEAYRGEEDKACHAARGITERNKVMYEQGGLIYVYLIYGLYWMLNFVTGKKGHPQAVLIRGVENISGPGRLTKRLKIDKSFYSEHLSFSERIWLERGTQQITYRTTPRIGIEYAGKYWNSKPWRYVVNEVT